MTLSHGTPVENHCSIVSTFGLPVFKVPQKFFLLQNNFFVEEGGYRDGFELSTEVMLVLFNSETKATLPHPIAASDLFSVFCSAFDSSQKDICLKYFHFHCQKATGVGMQRATSAPKYLTVYDALDEIEIFVLS